MEDIKIAVIDDDPKIRSMLERSLSYAGYKIITASDGLEGYRLVMEHKPNLLILDIMLPGLNGYEVCEQLKSLLDIPILMLTARDETRDKVKGLDCGADDYLVKPFSLEELLARVRALLRRFNKLTEALLEFADLKVDVQSYQVWRGKREIRLSAREFDLLTFFIRHPRQVLTREKLMDTVWGYDYEGESNVLEVYIGYLRSKLEGEGESRLIHTVRGVGYVMKEQEG